MPNRRSRSERQLRGTRARAASRWNRSILGVRMCDALAQTVGDREVCVEAKSEGCKPARKVLYLFSSMTPLALSNVVCAKNCLFAPFAFATQLARAHRFLASHTCDEKDTRAGMRARIAASLTMGVRGIGIKPFMRAMDRCGDRSGVRPGFKTPRSSGACRHARQSGMLYLRVAGRFSRAPRAARRSPRACILRRETRRWSVQRPADRGRAGS